MKMKKIVLVLSLFVFLTDIKAQVRFIVIPSIEGVFTAEQAFQFNVVNTNPNVLSQGTITMLLMTMDGQIVARYQSLPVALKPLQTQSGLNIEWLKQGLVSHNEAAVYFRDFGTLPYGNYSLCYSFDSPTEPKGRMCSEIKSQPQLPPRLLYPGDKEVIVTTNPVLTWLPPVPTLNIPYKYALKLVELKQGQTCAQALEQNAPIAQVNQYEDVNYAVDGSNGQDLAIDKTYCWQVGAYNKKTWFANTDIWQFSLASPLGQQGVQVAVEDDLPYNFLKRSLDGETIRANPQLKIAYDNRFGVPTLKYKIYTEGGIVRINVSDQIINLNQGINQIALDCTKLTGIKPNVAYIMEVTDENNSQYYCRFIYEKK